MKDRETGVPGKPGSGNILVVDDDAGQRSLFESFLCGQGYSIITASSGDEALEILRSGGISLMISDVRMPRMSGLEALREARGICPGLPILMVTAYPDIRDAVGAMREGAINYLEKPVDLDELLSLVRQALGPKDVTNSPPDDALNLPAHIVSQSQAILEVFREAALVAPLETRVLITGESGAGKEVVADFIHARSPRADKPFVKVNCAAIPESLLESELFGYEKGAFTGANQHRVGRFEEASDGTILLDEIAEMSPSLQSKLLRVTHDGIFQRLGSNRDRQTHARLLASTNRNLEREVEAGRFREDLYFRLNVMEIFVPPLRERRSDIVPLANHYAMQFSHARPRISPAAVACLELYTWPGNVRELRNAMERAILLSRGGIILPEHLPRPAQLAGLELDAHAAEFSPGGRMEDIERVAILQALQEHDYNRTATARALGISRRALTYKLRRFSEQGYRIDPE